MKKVLVKYGGFEAEQEVDENLYDAIYQQGRAEAVEEFRTYLKTVIPREMPQEIWNLGVDNTCNRMLKEQIND